MRKIVLGLAVSLDGYIEGPNGEIDWCLADQDYGMSDFFKKIDAVFMGRKSYEMAMAMGDAAVSGFPKLKEYVFSNTLKSVTDGMNLISGDIPGEVNKIKREPGRDIWLFGGAALISSFINHNVVDEYWLSIHPVILGGGKPLFSDIKKRINLKLSESKTYSSGLVSLRYTT
jgi:dihydrofolate reductase